MNSTVSVSTHPVCPDYSNKIITLLSLSSWDGENFNYWWCELHQRYFITEIVSLRDEFNEALVEKYGYDYLYKEGNNVENPFCDCQFRFDEKEFDGNASEAFDQLQAMLKEYESENSYSEWKSTMTF
jgi:hypothetical protein